MHIREDEKYKEKGRSCSDLRNTMALNHALMAAPLSCLRGPGRLAYKRGSLSSISINLALSFTTTTIMSLRRRAPLPRRRCGRFIVQWYCPILPHRRAPH